VSWEIENRLSVKEHVADLGLFETSDDSEQGGFPTARGSD
jgi:hypothetical protein